EWDTSEGNIKDFEEMREEHLSILRFKLKEVNSLLKNEFCSTLPLKIKAIILKALDREKNLESCLNKILTISPNNIWANTEMALLLFKKKQYEDSFRLLEFVKEIKEKEYYSSPYHIFPSFYLLKENDYNLFRLYKEAGKYREAILIMEKFLLNPYSQENIKINAVKIGKDLIYCYDKIANNVNDVIERTLILADKIDNINGEGSNIINAQKDPYQIRQCLIDFLFKERHYGLCLNLILDLSKIYSNILESRNIFLTPFNRNKFYLAECYLKLSNLVLAKKNYEESLEDLKDDIRFNAKAIILLIQPFPDHLKIKGKNYYKNEIEKGLKKISNLLERENLLENLIFKTNLERSIGNVSLLVRERAKKQQNLFENLQNQLNFISEEDKNYYRLILACSFAITGSINKMFEIINQENFEKSYPIVSTFLKVLYCFYENDYDKYIELNIKLHRLIPNSLTPLLLNLHFIRFKRGVSKIHNLNNLFKTVWKINRKKIKIYSIEKQVVNYFKNNLAWYPFKWALKMESYIKSSKDFEINQLFEVLHFIKYKQFNWKHELLDFITRFLNADRRIPEFLNLLLILESYNFPETKYYIYEILKPEIEQYELKTFGDIAYKAKKLNEFLPMLDDYRNKELKKYKETIRSDWNVKWLEERYVSFLLTCFKYSDLDEKISSSMKYLEKLEDYPKEKKRYFKVLLDLREKRYEGARIGAYQLLKWFKDDESLKWDIKYFKTWVLSKIISDLDAGKEIRPLEFFNEIDQLIDFNKLNNPPIYFRLSILDILNHELLEEYEREILNFAIILFKEIIHSIDWNDKNSHKIILEKIYFNRKIISQFPVDSIKYIDVLIDNLIPEKFYITRYNYLKFFKAIIYHNDKKIQMARQILEQFFSSVNEEDIYTIYIDVNDFYLDNYQTSK
ncbi:MAG: tetratricopeptide repeat protein, partial [Candidatus Hermodarchaeota archaeon]